MTQFSDDVSLSLAPSYPCPSLGSLDWPHAVTPDVDVYITATAPICASVASSIDPSASYFYGYSLTDLNLALNVTLSDCDTEPSASKQQSECSYEELLMKTST